MDTDGDGYLACEECDDSYAATRPGASEICDGEDNNCDGTVPTDEQDNDGDGFYPCQGDCDDYEADNFPGNTEVCDGVDNDCDDNLLAFEVDDDLDGVMVCEGDCDDADPWIWPGQIEICDGVDNDCFGGTDETGDMDGDGFSICAGDCFDANPASTPGGPNTDPVPDAGSDFVGATETVTCVTDSYGNAQCPDCPPMFAVVDGVASYDPDGDPLAYLWTGTTSDGSLTIDSPAQLSTEISLSGASAALGPTLTIVTLTLEAVDCNNASVTDTAEVTFECVGSL